MEHFHRFFSANRVIWLGATLLLLAVAVACGDDSDTVVEFTPQPARPSPESTVPPQPTASRAPSLDGSITLSAAEVRGLADLDVAAAFEDLRALVGADPDGVAVLRAERATWRDSSLGCPTPDTAYDQALTESLWLVLSYRDSHYDYRVSSSAVVRCEQAPQEPLESRPVPGLWTTLSPVPTVRSEVAVVELDGLVYVFGGFGQGETAAEAYDPKTDSWRELAQIPQPVNHAGAVTVGGLIYLVGGFDPRFRPVDSVLAYDPASDSWTRMKDLPAGRGGLGAVVVGDKVLAIGGRGARGNVGTNHAYDRTTDSWTSLSAMPTARDHVAAAVVDGRVYVIGGRLESFASNLGATEVYDPASDTWYEGAPLLTVRSGTAAATVQGRVYVFGGEETEGTFDENERYDPVLDSWESMPSMPTARHGLGAAAIGDRIYVMAGGTTTGGSASNVNEVFIVLAGAESSPQARLAPAPTRAPRSTATPSPAPSAGLIMGAGMIAYSNAEGQISVARPDGSSAVTVSPAPGFFTWPAWSPDGAELVFSAARSGTDQFRLEMYSHRFADQSTRLVFASEPDIGPILPNMPHYPLWSPDSSELSVMASHPQGLTLFLTGDAPDEPEVVIVDAPLYASWSPDSTQMVVHGGIELFLADIGGPALSVTGLDLADPRYRVPAWWPSGDRIALVASPPQVGRSLFIAHLDSGELDPVVDVPGEAAYIWSPDGTKLAVGQSEIPGGFVYGGISVYDPDGEPLSAGVDEDLIAFFWSPDSTKLAYVTAGLEGTMLWNILDVTDGSRYPLVEFTPSGVQSTVFQFFDQFALSHSMWSPDSRAIVFAGSLADAVQASYRTQTGSSIIVSEVVPVPLVETIADGLFAVWSPR